MSFKDEWDASRRVFVLRILVEVGGEANESIVYKSAIKGGFGMSSRQDLASDLDHLRRTGCLTEEWLGTLRVVKLTIRGEDAAYGRVEVDGVERSRWERG